MRDLQYVIGDCFSGGGVSRCYNSYNNLRENSNTKYFIIPIKDSFNIPVFALSALKGDTDSIVAQLQDLQVRTTYKSLDTGIRDTISFNFKYNKLAKLPTKVGEPTYYGTYGAIFDKDFTPIAMIMWEMEKKYSTSEESSYPFKYKFVKPILRVSPIVFINRSNTVERYIINKIIPAALEKDIVYAPNNRDSRFISTYNGLHLKVEISYFSDFTLRKVNVPSISTTNENLLEVALDNIEEIVE